MKKVQLFAGILAASMLVGGATAYTVTKISARQNAPRVEFVRTGGSGNHFTAYERENYPDLTYAAENAVPAVVSIEVTQVVQGRGGSQGYNPFYEFFGGGQMPRQQPQERYGGGSGVIISPDGYIVTNHHVVENATRLKVTLEDKSTYEATLIGTDPTTEVALIKIDAKDLPTIAFGNSDKLRLGEWVLAIGYPLGLQSTVTAGIVSAKGRGLDIITRANPLGIESFIQTDAAVNPGNSGGALVNTRGELVGINTLIRSETGSYIGYSFAVPSSIVQKVVVDLKEYGVVQRALLGVTMREVNAAFLETDEAKKAGVKELEGVYVVGVEADGAAKAAGIREGDVITGIDGVKIEASTTLTEAIARHRPNDKVTLTVKRNGEVKQIEVTLRNRSGSTNLVEKDTFSYAEMLKGQFRDITDKAKKDLGIEGGVAVVGVEPGGLLDKGSIGRGFIITRIDDRPIRSVTDLSRVGDSIETIHVVAPDGEKYRVVFPKSDR